MSNNLRKNTCISKKTKNTLTIYRQVSILAIMLKNDLANLLKNKGAKLQGLLCVNTKCQPVARKRETLVRH